MPVLCGGVFACVWCRCGAVLWCVHIYYKSLGSDFSALLERKTFGPSVLTLGHSLSLSPVSVFPSFKTRMLGFVCVLEAVSSLWAAENTPCFTAFCVFSFLFLAFLFCPSQDA